MKVSSHFILFFLFFLVILFSIDSVFSINSAFQSSNWKSTTGTVIYSFIDNTSDPSSLIFEYSYSVHGKNFTSINIYPEGPFHLSNLIENSLERSSYFIEHYHKGSLILVYYDPSNPANSAIIRDFGLVHVINALLLIFLIFSFGISIFTYKRNDFFPNFTKRIERIILTQLLNYFLFIFTFLFLVVFTTLFVLLLLVAVGFVVQSLIILLNFLIQLVNAFPGLQLLINLTILVLFLTTLSVFLLLLIKGLYSLSIKWNRKYYYSTSFKKIEQDYKTGKWTLSINGYYNDLHQIFHFNHDVRKRFRSEESAENFFQKRIYQPDFTKESNTYLKRYINSKGHKFRSFKKGVYKKQTKDEGKNLILGYEIFSNYLLFCMPILFISIDFVLLLIIEFIVNFSSLSANQINYTVFTTTVNNYFPNVIIIIFFLLVLGIQGLYMVENTILLTKWYIINIYKRFLLNSKGTELKPFAKN